MELHDLLVEANGDNESHRNGLSAMESQDMLLKLLVHHNSNFNPHSIAKLSNLVCAFVWKGVESQMVAGTYFWASVAEIQSAQGAGKPVEFVEQ